MSLIHQLVITIALLPTTTLPPSHSPIPHPHSVESDTCPCEAVFVLGPLVRGSGRAAVGRMPRHSTTNDHRAATSLPLPSLRDVGTMIAQPRTRAAEQEQGKHGPR
jgi:hypothetical protein